MTDTSVTKLTDSLTDTRIMLTVYDRMTDYLQTALAIG
jgi:hypothetical protein